MKTHTAEIKEFVKKCGKEGYLISQTIDAINYKFGEFVKIKFDEELFEEFVDGQSEFDVIVSAALSGV